MLDQNIARLSVHTWHSYKIHVIQQTRQVEIVPHYGGDWEPDGFSNSRLATHILWEPLIAVWAIVCHKRLQLACIMHVGGRERE